MTLDPVFKLPCSPPLVFAHRGGAGEVPESTELAFLYAIKSGADVLEVDVQLTRDGDLVVWHGPSLDNVSIDGLPRSSEERKDQGTRNIHEVALSGLEGCAQVDSPDGIDVAAVRELIGETAWGSRACRDIMTFDRFLQSVAKLEKEITNRRNSGSPVALNIELKGNGFEEDGARRKFLDVLDRHAGADRAVLLTSVSDAVMAQLRSLGHRYAEGVPKRAQFEFAKRYRWWVRALTAPIRWVRRNDWRKPENGWALQTSHYFVTQQLVDHVHSEGGAVHIFITHFGLPGLIGKDSKEEDIRSGIRKLVDMGVDGIMTDYPRRVRHILQALESQD